MLALRGIYDGRSIKVLEKIPFKKKTNVIITFIDEPIVESDIIRELNSDSASFDFWNNSKEDLYQEYLQ